MRRLTVLILSMALLGVAYVGGAAPTASAAKAKPTPFAFYASGFGTRVVGGDVPADSSRTASRVLNCTNVGNISRSNNIASATVPGSPISVGVSETTVSTIAKPKKKIFASVSRQRIAELNIVDTPLGALKLRGLTSTARAESRNGRLRTSSSSNLGELVAVSPLGTQKLPLPTVDQPFEIPGVVRIEVGRPTSSVNKQRVIAADNVLRITLPASDTRVIVSSARARIERGIRTGIFSGFAAGLRANALDGNVIVGRNPLVVMPCVGTGGELKEESLAGLDLAGGIDTGVLEVAQRAVNGTRKATGVERARVADVSLAGGALVIKGVSSRAEVVRRPGKKLVRKAAGQVLSVTAQGETQTLPLPGESLDIPGLATITPRVVKRTPTGLEVVGLRVELVDGDVAVVDLAVSKVAVRKGVIRR